MGRITRVVFYWGDGHVWLVVSLVVAIIRSFLADSIDWIWSHCISGLYKQVYLVLSRFTNDSWSY